MFISSYLKLFHPIIGYFHLIVLEILLYSETRVVNVLIASNVKRQVKKLSALFPLHVSLFVQNIVFFGDLS